MSLEATIQENTNAIRMLICALQLSATAAPEKADKKAEPKKAAPKAKEPEPETIEEPTEAPIEETIDEPKTTSEHPSYEETADVIMALAKSKGAVVVKSVLATFGVSRLPELGVEHYAAVIAACKAA